MKKEHINEIQGVVILAFGLILLASLASFVPEDLSWFTPYPNTPAKNLIRIVGAYGAGALFFVFGYSAYCLVVFLIFWGWNKFTSRAILFSFSKFVSFLVSICVVSSLFSLAGAQESTVRFLRGGLVGYLGSDFLVRYIGTVGAYVILIAMGTLTLIVIAEVLVSPLVFKAFGSAQDALAAFRERWEESRQTKVSVKPVPKFREPVKVKAPPRPTERPEVRVAGKKEEESLKDKLLKKMAPPPPPAREPVPEKPQIRITAPPEEPPKPDRVPEPIVVGSYRLPTLDLLADPPPVSSSQLQSDLHQGARILEETLSDFNVSARVADIERGPVITRYELEPAPGVKVQRITTLSDDIALAMKASTVRIVAPIPGKNRVGIEVPNSSTAMVFLKELIPNLLDQKKGSKLKLAIGKDISGMPMIADLADMPHLLIAGTTGSGKTVCVNSLIMSMLYNASPDEVKFLMVDPKMVELTMYNDIPHMLCPAVTDHKKVSAALNWIVSEMESRYSLLSKSGVRNISAYHAKGFQMPYIVVIIDELADLMQVSAKTIESAITRLAQLSRAVGIHLILATQRPSVDVI
ncbi:MAG: DNA translocase FtsK, partial [Candidatus Omnitrophota bacterium]|nr:DNA translocase FtsK [Candidatus Omnitrophota bacterium]